MLIVILLQLITMLVNDSVKYTIHDSELNAVVSMNISSQGTLLIVLYALVVQLRTQSILSSNVHCIPT